MSDTTNTRLTRGMWYLYAVIGLTFVVLAILHVPHPRPWLWAPYAAGAAITLVSLIPNLGILLSRLLAVAATAILFFFFAGFFMEVPKLESDWYSSQEGWTAVSLLVGAFGLLPVLSNFSCRCKARCEGHHRIPRFFTAPDSPGSRSS
ncbi:MAG: hypothetical protein ACODAC_07170 [Pseudomonadota bacterium]